MSGDPHWPYVQARLQARHGERLDEAGWRALEAAQAADAFLDRARAGSLRRFAEQVNANLSSHAIERALRAAWRGYVAEIAAWLPPAWRPAVLWTSLMPDLPAIDALLADATPRWAAQDSWLAPFSEPDMTRRHAALQASPFAPLLPRDGDSTPLGARWAQHWRALWPQMSAADARALNALARAVRDHIVRLAHAGPQERSAPHRRDLERVVTRLFRRHAASPTAVFAHLLLTALDLERLRGGLVRRRLFEPARRRQAA
ncbi:MAG TPA: hypothetical protein VE224_10835 [Pseudolabrys sp.]|nr:hypothetical protein [Pseudolabrys sp.]